jgi:hypothetical protein
VLAGPRWAALLLLLLLLLLPLISVAANCNVRHLLSRPRCFKPLRLLLLLQLPCCGLFGSSSGSLNALPLSLLLFNPLPRCKCCCQVAALAHWSSCCCNRHASICRLACCVAAAG